MKRFDKNPGTIVALTAWVIHVVYSFSFKQWDIH